MCCAIAFSPCNELLEPNWGPEVVTSSDAHSEPGSGSEGGIWDSCSRFNATSCLPSWTLRANGNVDNWTLRTRSLWALWKVETTAASWTLPLPRRAGAGAHWVAVRHEAPGQTLSLHATYTYKERRRAAGQVRSGSSPYLDKFELCPGYWIENLLSSCAALLALPQSLASSLASRYRCLLHSPTLSFFTTSSSSYLTSCERHYASRWYKYS